MRTLFSIAFLALLSIFISGAKADSPSKTTRDFIAMCDTAVPSMDCLLEYEVALTALNWNDDGTGKDPDRTCESVPSSEISPEGLQMRRAQVLTILTWLKHHPENDSKADTYGIEAAVHAIYPCK